MIVICDMLTFLNVEEGSSPSTITSMPETSSMNLPINRFSRTVNCNSSLITLLRTVLHCDQKKIVINIICQYFHSSIA